MSSQFDLKMAAASKALSLLGDATVIGVGSGSTVNCFVQQLATLKHRIDGVVAASEQSAQLLKQYHLPVLDLHVAGDLPLYFDGADEINHDKQMIKGAGGALTREKIIANVAQTFICMVDERKLVKRLGGVAIALEVIPMARSYVAREVVKLGGSPQYREGFVTDNGNIILDVYDVAAPLLGAFENTLNNIPGVVENGLFIRRPANQVIVAKTDGVFLF